MRLRRSFALLLTTALAAACGSDDDQVDPAADREAARRAIAAFEERMRDVGFAVAGQDGDDDEDVELASEDCRQFADAVPGDDEPLPGQTAEEESGSFERGELDTEGGTQESVEAMVTFVEDEESLDELFAVLADDRLGPCLVEGLEAGFAEQADEETVPMTLGAVEVDSFDVDGIGEQAVGVRISTSLTASGFTFPLAFEQAAARSGRIAANVMAMAIGEGDSVNVDVERELEQLLDDAG